jgi:hypothetical protein
MQIVGQNTINGNLALEINDPYLNAIKTIIVQAGDVMSVDDSFRFAPSVISAVNTGLITISPEADDEVTQSDLNATDTRMTAVHGGVSGGALPAMTEVWYSHELGQYPDATWLNVTVTFRNTDPSLGVNVAVTSEDNWGIITTTSTTVNASETIQFAPLSCKNLRIQVGRETTGVPSYQLVIWGIAGLQ